MAQETGNQGEEQTLFFLGGMPVLTGTAQETEKQDGSETPVRDFVNDLIGSGTLFVGLSAHTKFVYPLKMDWQPKEDITAYELAMCLPYFFSSQSIMPYQVDMSLPHFRHFDITDPNI